MDTTRPQLYLILRITSGTDAGRTIEISSGQVVYIGRAPTMERTTATERIALEPEPEQLERIERYLGGRAPTRRDPESTDPGWRPRLDHFKRMADVRLTDGTVSRVHALIFIDGEKAGIVDLASTNGTIVNGRKVSASPIRAGDHVEFGNVRAEVGGLG